MTAPLAPVTAAVDPTKVGGFDEAGKWHDPYGRFARRGASAVKVALLRILDGDRAKAAVLSAGPDGADLHLSSTHHLVGVLGRGPHRVHFRDARYGRFDGPDGKPVLVRWDQFDEAGLPDPPRSEKAPPVPSVPSYEESERRRARWTGVVGDMTRYGASEEGERGDRAQAAALATVSDADLARIADALESLGPDAREAFGVRSTERMFPGGKLPDGVDFWFDYGVGMMAEAPPPTRIEDTHAYATYKPIIDGWRSNPEMFTKRHPGDFDPTRPISRDNEPFGGLVDDAEAEMADARRRHDNIPEERKIRTPEQAKIAAAREFVGSLFAGWAESSLSYRSVIFQRAVADEFGLHYDAYASDDVKADAQSIYDAAPDAWRGYVRSLYDQTQQALAAAGVTAATVFRGADQPADAPLSSWSVSPNIASSFGAEVRRADVPAADIFATPLLTGIGKSEEGEVVLLNRDRRQWTIARPGDPRDHGAPDGRMFDMWFDYDQEDVQSPPPGWEPGATNDLIEASASSDAPVAPPATTWPSERLVGDLSFVDDTTIPWADRVARLAAERDALVERLGPNAHRWFTSPLTDTLDRVWNNPDGLYREERQSLDRVQAITAFGTALSTLVAEKADDLTGGEPLRLYTPDASRAIIDAIEEFAPRSTTGALAPNPSSNGGALGAWSGRDAALEAWPLLVDGIRNGTTDFVVKKNEVILIGAAADGTLVRATIAKRDYGGDWGGGYTERLPSGRNVYRHDGRGHIDVEVLSERQSYMNPSAWTRGAGTFESLHKATKDALATSAKASFADLSNPPTLRAWAATMEAMGVDMSTNPDLPVSTGAVQEHEVTVMAWGQAVQVPRPNWDAIQNGERTPLGKLKASSAAAKTINAGLAPYPRWWTDTLPPQHIHMPNSTSAKGGSAGNMTLSDGSNYIVTPSLVGHPQHASSAAHEFGHSMQKVIPAVHRAEAWSLIDRLARHPGESPDGVSRGRGVGYRDHFAEDYSGRFYLHPDAPDDMSGGDIIPSIRTFEMFTTGVQTLFDTPGTRRARRGFGADPELSGLALGLMAVVPRPADIAVGDVFTGHNGVKVRRTADGYVDDATGQPVHPDGTPL